MFQCHTLVSETHGRCPVQVQYTQDHPKRYYPSLDIIQIPSLSPHVLKAGGQGRDSDNTEVWILQQRPPGQDCEDEDMPQAMWEATLLLDGSCSSTGSSLQPRCHGNQQDDLDSGAPEGSLCCHRASDTRSLQAQGAGKAGRTEQSPGYVQLFHTLCGRLVNVIS